ncbi:ABC transporter ATP-binding protein [Acetoanaerobium noterae]|uniref:ABC transporter ATP-binding protein n=1 Tax=Acetoanaerobium noterae TaxID=745369 RepID=UPI0032214DDD
MIALNNINISYGNLKVLENFSISLEKGKVHCIFGASGCGKTTLLNALTGINKIESGEKFSLENKKFSYVFQEDRLLPWATALENVLFVLRDRYCDEEAKQIAEKYLNIVGLGKFINAYPSELSGGMQRRVSFARALSYWGEVFILDEPFKGLDFKLKTELINYLLESDLKENSYIVFVTHDMQEALSFSDYIYMVDGPPLKIIEKIETHKNK